MFSIITIASSTTKPVEIVSAMSERLSRLYPSRYMTPKVPTIERGRATLGMMVADGLRRKRNSTITTSATVSIRENSTSCTDARIVVVVGQDLHLDRGGQRGGELRQQPLDPVDHADD